MEAKREEAESRVTEHVNQRRDSSLRKSDMRVTAHNFGLTNLNESLYGQT